MKVALIDADSLLFICLYNKKDEKEKTLDECKKKLDDMITNILTYTHSTHYLLTLTIGKNFRYKIKSDYKADRVGKADTRPAFFKECREYLIVKYGAIFNENLESDDLVNIFKHSIDDSFICACDSDILYGLEGQHFDYRNFKWINTNKEEANYKFWHDMIVGTHNGIKGIPGKGTKFAENTFAVIEAEDYMSEVLLYYIGYFEEELGIEEFYKNYKCLKIKDKWDGIEIPTPKKFERKMMDESEERME